MATVHVSLQGPSRSAVQARLEEIARDAELDLHPLHATASFVAGAPTTTYSMETALHGLSLDEAQVRSRLEPFEDEDVDPQVRVRFVVLP